MKRTASIALVVIGAIVFLFGHRTDQQAAWGQQQVSQAEANEEGRRRPIIGPVRKAASAQATESGQQRISQAEEGIVKSEVTADWLQGTGLVLFFVGASIFAYDLSRRRRT